MDKIFLTDWDDFTMPDKMELCKIDPPSKLHLEVIFFLSNRYANKEHKLRFSLYNFHDDIYPNAYLFLPFMSQ